MNPLRNSKGNMLQQFLEFKKSIAGQDPQQIYNQLVQSGKYSAEQIEWAKKKAQEFQNFLK